VKKNFPNALYLDLLEAELFNDLVANPQRLDNLIPAGFKNWIIIDEVQRVPELLHEVHRQIENNRHKFILTGSSARKLKKKGPNLLAGRALTYYLYPLTVKEVGKDFNIDQSVKYGQLPSIYQEKDPKKYLESYVQTYLQEEIQQEGLTRSLSAFSRFLETASFSQGSVLNVSEIAREAMIERKVVENYFAILEDLLIGCRLPIFNKQAKRRLIAHTKFYYFDAGIYRVLRPKGPLDTPETIDGAALETLFFQELRALNDYYNLNYQLYYYRTVNQHEVDFVAYGERGLKAFEIKRTNKINFSMLRGLKLFLKDYPSAKAHFIYGGKRKMKVGNIEIWPIVDALRNLLTLLSR